MIDDSNADPPELSDRSLGDVVLAAAPLRRFALPLSLAFVAWWSVRTGIVHVLPVGDFHGAGRAVRALGVLAGIAGGLAAWRAAAARFSPASALVIALAVASMFASLPGQLDQTAHLLRTYADMSSARAERSGGYQIPSAQDDVGSFDALRRAIPPHGRYVLYADAGYTLWAHNWLLPRIAAPSPATAGWAILHGRGHVAGLRLRSVRRIDGATWVGRVVR